MAKEASPLRVNLVETDLTKAKFGNWDVMFQMCPHVTIWLDETARASEQSAPMDSPLKAYKLHDGDTLLLGCVLIS